MEYQDYIDEADNSFHSLMAEINNYDNSIFTEMDTRIKVIDRIFTEVLGWNYSDIQTEEKVGSGFLDYRFSISGAGRLIVEAKRDGADFGLNARASGASYKLNGSVFNIEVVNKGIHQAISYAAYKSIELACVSNGREWIIFRANRLGDGKEILEGKAIIFKSLEEIKDNFKKFFDLLSCYSVSKFVYRALFQEAEGIVIRPHTTYSVLRPPSTRMPTKASPLTQDIAKVMNAFFQRLSGKDDPDLLRKCFVTSKYSDQAEEKLARISEDLITTIRGLAGDTDAELKALIERAKSSHLNEFILLVGTKGAGKSTFIDRFFKDVLDAVMRNEIYLLRVNLADSAGAKDEVIGWLNDELIFTTENTVYGSDGPSYAESVGIFYGEYQRLRKGDWAPLYEIDKGQFKIDFGKFISDFKKEKPHKYIKKLLRRIVASRKKLPCLIFDNADHFTIGFQEKVIQYARSLYDNEVCIVIMPITDKTSWHLSRYGVLQSFEYESIYLPTPPTKRILERRIRYLQDKIEEEGEVKGSTYFLERGIALNIKDLYNFSLVLTKVFINHIEVSKWISRFSNQDIRRALELTKEIICSPELSVDELLKAYLIGEEWNIKVYKIIRAIIKQKYNIYPSGEHKYIQNIYDLETQQETSPLLGVRILQLLFDVYTNRSVAGYISKDQIIKYFEGMGVDAFVTYACLEELFITGLCYSYDPTHTQIDTVNRLKLTPSGLQHWAWGINQKDYILPMLEVSRIYDQDAYDNLNSLIMRKRREVWFDLIQGFIEYLILKDKEFCLIPDLPAYHSQARIRTKLYNLIERESQWFYKT